MPIRDLQMRARELGRIRIGQTIPITKKNGDPGIRPEKLDRFRLTSASRPLLERVADLYGGGVREWQPQGGGAKAWEVITDTQRLPILVPPMPVTQFMEHWTGGTCKRRCDSVTELLSDQPCICKANEAELCKPTTRLNVVLRDIEGIGVWRLETHGWNAALELPDSAAFLAQAGGYVEGFLALEQRTSKAEVVRNGETKIETRHFMVPTIEISVTPAQLMAGKGRIATPAIEGPVPAAKTLEAGPDGQPDPYVDLSELVASASTLEELARIWDRAKEQGLAGPRSPGSARREGFVEAFKARAHVVKDTAAPEVQQPTEQPVDGEVVHDDGPEADRAWASILKAAGELDPPMTTSQVQEDFQTRFGLTAGSASVGELEAYLAEISQGAGVPA